MTLIEPIGFSPGVCMFSSVCCTFFRVVSGVTVYIAPASICSRLESMVYGQAASASMM